MIKKILNSFWCLMFVAATATAQSEQTPKPSPTPEESGDVVRVYTDLRQTDVMVFDSNGRFVKGLNREDFEVRIDGKPVPITFFERVEAGGENEEEKWIAARGEPTANSAVAPSQTRYGRKVLFFVDDIHISPANIRFARELILKYIDQELGEADEAQIVSASGGVGFFQQLTDNKMILRSAVERLKPYHRTGKDYDVPPISAYQAFQIDRGDTDTLNYFVDELIKVNRLLTRKVAEDLVRARAANIMRQATHWTLRSLEALDFQIRESANIPGRKLLFFISDGFFIDRNYSDSSNIIRSIATTAARSGVVIYSMDARGLVVTLVDDRTGADPSGRLLRASQGEVFAYQEPLSAFAHDTGGRALFNNNDLYRAVENGLRETSFYYLLGWRPERTGDNPNKFRRLEVTVVGRPELTTRVRKGAFNLETPKAARRKESEKQQTVESKLHDALVATNPSRQIPVSLALNYVDTPDRGGSLSVLMEIPTEALSSDVNEEKGSSHVDLVAALFDDEGKSTINFGQKVTLAEALKKDGRRLTYTHTVFTRPGLYQVRVAARDGLSGRVGTARSWIRIPDLTKKELTLSSIVVGERLSSNSADSVAAGQLFSDQIPLNIARSFKRNSFMRCLVFVYNASRVQGDSSPNVTVQVQVLRNNQPVVTTPAKKITIQPGLDTQRLPYATEVPLEGLPAGKYLLAITVIDLATKKSASEQLKFDIQ